MILVGSIQNSAFFWVQFESFNFWATDLILDLLQCTPIMYWFTIPTSDGEVPYFNLAYAMGFCLVHKHHEFRVAEYSLRFFIE
jgi:hypothetical protein